MDAIPIEVVSKISPLWAEGKTVLWKLPSWSQQKEVHVAGSTLDVDFQFSQKRILFRYGLKWTNHTHHTYFPLVGGHQSMTRYLSLVVEAHDWDLQGACLAAYPGCLSDRQLASMVASLPDLLQVKLSTNCKTDGNARSHPYDFETCVKFGQNEKATQITLFEKMIPDATWDIQLNGEYCPSSLTLPTPEGDELCLTITTNILHSNPRKVVICTL